MDNATLEPKDKDANSSRDIATHAITHFTDCPQVPRLARTVTHIRIPEVLHAHLAAYRHQCERSYRFLQVRILCHVLTHTAPKNRSTPPNPAICRLQTSATGAGRADCIVSTFS
jgi:hypothetical protein